MSYKNKLDKIKWKFSNKEKEKEYRQRHKEKYAERTAKAKEEKARVREETARLKKEEKEAASLEKKQKREEQRQLKLSATTKVCTKCNQEKDKATCFVKDASKADGYYSICLDCKRNYVTDWVNNNREKKRESDIKYKKKKLSNVTNLTTHNIRVLVSFGLSREVKMRDKRKCVLCKCNDRSNLQVHHIEPVSCNLELIMDVNNLVTLCKECHFKAHNNNWADIDKDIATQLKEYIKSLNNDALDRNK